MGLWAQRGPGGAWRAGAIPEEPSLLDRKMEGWAAGQRKNNRCRDRRGTENIQKSHSGGIRALLPEHI